MDASELLPRDAERAALVGRVWRPDVQGPSPVAVRPDGVYDLAGDFATVRDLSELDDPAAAVRAAGGERLGSLDDLVAATVAGSTTEPTLLAPVDLHAVKASGVTFAASMIERVIEERAGGDPAVAERLRADVRAQVGDDLSNVRPGSDGATRIAEHLKAQGMWSQYLEVGLGPDAEIFTKAQPLSAVGALADVGVLPASSWNNPEPEVALVVSSAGRAQGAVLANDVNLRDIEGRSALLLGKAKDNNASCALGPFVRFFDDTFSLDDVRAMEVHLNVTGDDGFTLAGSSLMSQISRDPLDLVGQLMGRYHQYPDGAVLLLGTMFAPTQDRGGEGLGFTHQEGDIVRISSDSLGTLVNRVRPTDACPPWTFGISHLMRNLAERGLL